MALADPHQVAELLAFPRQSCPDVLVLGLLQINPPITLLRQDLLGKLFKVGVFLLNKKVLLFKNKYLNRN